ncbi:pyridoxal phosphate-dependent aminotransferase [Pararobbsia silviterrae]|uniref:Pyridoxal phosphate-dependent aminotransferase n=1 Tax=Pararobbsia silviterrae TaxID=1792498 RepID=A0A494X7Z1_9BURK|nr:pyridoxal phosphate-dependent aminotransferase [Pararobbsia silviterrae]RKP44456.1 pyridoxal phosphate-dependent aminotransferase [Pararobbsia silviterrae]
MPVPRAFQLIAYLAKWEHHVRHVLSSSYPESLSIDALREIAGVSDDRTWLDTPLDYPPLRGTPALLETISRLYATTRPDDIASFAGGDEALYATFHALLDRDAHVIVPTPNYQSLESLPMSLCDVTGIPLDAARDWHLDLDRVRDALRPNTRLIVVNFPHNPTGAVLPRATFDALIELCRARGIWLLSDEVYRMTEYDVRDRLPPVVDVYERGISLNVTSKAYALPGLRIGWIACRDTALLDRVTQMKQYLSVCNALPSEHLATVALAAEAHLVERVMTLARARRDRVGAVLERYPSLFQWRAPKAGVLAYPKYLGRDGAQRFAERLVQARGVLVVPSTVYASELGDVSPDYLRIGFGKANLDAALESFEAFLEDVRIA